MGFLDRLAVALGGDPMTADTTVTIPPLSGDVAQVQDLPADVALAFGINVSSDTVTRKEAMTIPAVKQGRNVICGPLGSAPLVAMRTIGDQPPQRVTRPLLTQPDPRFAAATVLTWTFDDLLFNGWSLWRITARDSQGFPTSAERIERHRVAVGNKVDPRVRIDGDLVDDRDLIAFAGPDEGLLRHGARALRTALMLEDAVRKFARLDVPLGFFEDQVGQMLEAEVDAFLTSWETHRQSRTTGYVPHGLKYEVPGFNAQQLELSGARSFQSQEVARLMGLPPSYINAPTSDSLTYATTEGNRRELVDISLAGFRAAVEQRLSMPDVTPAGTVVHLDLSGFIRGDLKDVIETGAAAVNAGLMTRNEVRTEWLHLPPLDQEESNGNA